jgi:signal-transduction protein with cAMP-binding, CBS, and nucleotidyltransferase domain
LEDGQNLNTVLELSLALNMVKIQDKELPHMVEFMSTLPAFGGRFNDLKRAQSRYCIEKMKIKLYERGTILFKKGQSHIYAYIVLLGVVNIYDDRSHEHSEDGSCSDHCPDDED